MECLDGTVFRDEISKELLFFLWPGKLPKLMDPVGVCTEIWKVCVAECRSLGASLPTLKQICCFSEAVHVLPAECWEVGACDGAAPVAFSDMWL